MDRFRIDRNAWTFATIVWRRLRNAVNALEPQNCEADSLVEESIADEPDRTELATGREGVNSWNDVEQLVTVDSLAARLVEHLLVLPEFRWFLGLGRRGWCWNSWNSLFTNGLQFSSKLADAV